MEVPFVDSGALSRTHYTLVRNVENASSPQAVDEFLFSQIDSIRDRLRKPSLSFRECKKCLVILLYCAMNITATDLDLSFALSHAINLAEVATSVQDKRIGYLFCVEIMPVQHSLQLLLVNTLRKDLESSSISRICLALDTMIQSPFEDLIPAVQARLYDILSHNSPGRAHVRRRALFALRALSKEQTDLIKPVISKVRKRLHDSEPSVASAALMVIADLVNSSLLSADTISSELHDLLLHCWKYRSEVSHVSLMTKTLHMLRVFSALNPDHCQLYTDIAHFSCQPGRKFPTLLFESVLSLSTCSIDLLHSSSSPYISPVNHIRHLLTSEDPNERYLFLCILESLEPRIWAGTVPEIPAVLDAWEVERMMQLLDARDGLIRAKTLTILGNVDSSIVESYFSRMLESQSSAVDVDAQTEYAMRLVQVLEVLSVDDGELYARYLKQVLGGLEGMAQDSRHVFREVVEKVLVYIRQAQTTFRIGCSTALLTSVTEPEIKLGSTSMVIIAALTCEYSNVTSIPPPALLRGFADRLPVCSASVKEACLLAMLRVVADCEEIPEDVKGKVQKASEVSGRYLRRRYDQFTSLATQKHVLRRILSSAKSPSLPDFAVALEAHNRVLTGFISSAESSGTPSQSSDSRTLASESKLRYAAYEAPRPTSRLSSHTRPKRRSRSSTSGSSRLSVETRYSEEAMSKTVTAGELTLMATDKTLETVAQGSPKHERDRQVSISNTIGSDVQDIASGVDLIAFDSPFVTDPDGAAGSEDNTPDQEFEFEVTWNRLTRSSDRGWCELSPDNLVRRLQALKLQLRVISADQSPFQGDLKVVAMQEGQEPKIALLRLRECNDEDESCVWRLRSDDEQLRVGIRRCLITSVKT